MLTQSLMPNEKARRVGGETISIEVKRSEESQLKSMNIETLKGGKVISPSGRNIFRGNQTENGIVDMKVSLT